MLFEQHCSEGHISAVKQDVPFH